MSGLIAGAHLGGISQMATGSLIAAVWQGVLLATIAALVLRLLPRTPAAVRFAIWFGVFLLVTALPLISLVPHAATGLHTAGNGAAWLVIDERWCLALAGVWALASLIRAATLIAAAFRVRALWKRATPVNVLHPTLRKDAKDGAPEQLGPDARRAQICVSDEVDRPTVIGFFSPKILIPGWLLDKLMPAELEQVVLHEAGHLGRADDWMNLLQKIALVLFPLNPALAWVERRLCFERELACDDRVLRATGAPKAYAACLATLAEYRLERRGLIGGLALALGALGRESELGRRVARILRRSESMKPAHARLVLRGAMLALMVGAVSLAHSPELVAFAPAAAPTSSAHIDAAFDLTSRSARPYRMQAVVFRVGDVSQGLKPHGAEPRVSGLKPGPISETKAMASDNNKAMVSATRATEWSRVPQISPPRRGFEPQGLAQSTDSSTPGASAPTFHWVMVTSWQSNDGSRLVMTTEGISNATRRAAMMPQSDEAPAAQQTPQPAQPAAPNSPQTAPASQQQSSPQLYPYAAVPVRGGWLIVQM